MTSVSSQLHLKGISCLNFLPHQLDPHFTYTAHKETKLPLMSTSKGDAENITLIFSCLSLPLICFYLHHIVHLDLHHLNYQSPFSLCCISPSDIYASVTILQLLALFLCCSMCIFFPFLIPETAACLTHSTSSKDRKTACIKS